MQHYLTVSMVNVRGHQGRCRVWCWRQGKRGRGGLQVRDALLAAFERVESKIGQSLAEPLGNGQGPVFCQEMLHDPETLFDSGDSRTRHPQARGVTERSFALAPGWSPDFTDRPTTLDRGYDSLFPRTALPSLTHPHATKHPKTSNAIAVTAMPPRFLFR